MIHLAVCDDDPAARLLLSNYIDRFFQERGEPFRLALFESSEDFLAHYPSDLDILLLDIRMFELSGLELAKRIRQFDEQLCIIFISNMPQYALEGYEVQAFNFLVKPFGYEIFRRGMTPAIKQAAARRSDALTLRCDTGMIRLPVRSILYAETLNHKLLLHCADGQSVVCYSSMNQLERQLSGKNFFRCHVSFLINLAAIERLDAAEVFLCGGTRVPISRHRKKELMHAIAQYAGEVL